jgi:hypothetical protein
VLHRHVCCLLFAVCFKLFLYELASFIVFLFSSTKCIENETKCGGTVYLMQVAMCTDRYTKLAYFHSTPVSEDSSDVSCVI